MIIITYRPLYCVFALKLGIPSRKFLTPPLLSRRLLFFTARAEPTSVAETRHQHHNLDPTNTKCRGGLTVRRKAPNPPNRSTDEVALERGTPRVRQSSRTHGQPGTV